MKMTRKEGKVNVAAIARRICGIKDGKPVHDMDLNEKHNFWNVSKALSNRKSYTWQKSQKTGYGMKLVEQFVLSH